MMGYHRYRKRRYWVRPYYNRRPYNSSHPRYRYIFGFNTGEAATIVREIFFSLSGEALNHVLDKYGKQYGKGAKAYAKSTIFKWETGRVNMSDALVGRLLDFLPPLMTAAQKNRVVEAIWKAHAGRSRKYAYIGPDTNVEAFCEALRSYLNELDVTHTIPGEIERTFSWLADDDAVAKQELLNHFMEKQLEAAFEAARHYVNLIVERINSDAEGQISTLEHAIVVGNHQVVIKADRQRSGFVFSNSANDFYRPPFKFKLNTKWWLAGAAVVICWLYFTNYNGQTSQGSSLPQRHFPSHEQEQNQPPLYGAMPSPKSNGVAKTAAKPVYVPMAVLPERQGTPAPTVAPSQRIIARTSAYQGESVVVSGCATYAVASVSGDGSSVVLSSGKQYSISDMLMRVEASSWSTGDELTACATGHNTSLKRNFETVQAAFAGHADVRSYGCRPLYVGYSADGGAEVVTTDGMIMRLVDNALARAEASQWSTGDSVSVCVAQESDVAYAGIKRDFQEVEATIGRVGSGRATPPSCSQLSVADSLDSDGIIQVGRGRYRVADTFMCIS